MTGGGLESGYFVAPTVFDHVPWDSTIAQEEIFGPVLSVIRVPDFEEALRVANSVKYGLIELDLHERRAQDFRVH